MSSSSSTRRSDFACSIPPGGETASWPANAFPRSVRESIAKIDLRRLEPPACAKFEVFVKEPREDFSALGVTFQRRGATVEVHTTGVTNGEGFARDRALRSSAKRASARKTIIPLRPLWLCGYFSFFF